MPVPETTFVEGSGNAFNTIPPSDFGFFELLNELVQENPAGSTDADLMGQLAAIGIVKGKPFDPDQRMRRILEDAAAVGSATSRALVFDARASEGFEYYEGSAWLSNLWIGGYTFETPPPLVTPDGIEPLPATGVKAVNARTAFFYGFTGITPAMCMRLTGLGSQYIMLYKDSDGTHLDGAMNYQVTLPPDIPAARFWSLTAYDTETRSMLHTPQRFPRVGSQAYPTPAATANTDGSTTITFGAQRPAQSPEGNWIQTAPGKGWFLILRLYSPLQPFFDKSWRPSEVELVEVGLGTRRARSSTLRTNGPEGSGAAATLVEEGRATSARNALSRRKGGGNRCSPPHLVPECLRLSYDAFLHDVDRPMYVTVEQLRRGAAPSATVGPDAHAAANVARSRAPPARNERGRVAIRRCSPRGASAMSWRTRFRRRENLLESLWVVPVLGAILGGILGTIVSVADEHLEAPTLWQYTPSTASAVLTSIVGATAALTGFVVTVTVLLVQMATGTFSARIMRLWYRDRLLKTTLAVLVGTMTFSFSVLRRIEDDFVPDLGVTLSGISVSLCLLVFIVFFDRSIRRLRPVAVAADVARAARSTFAQTVRLADRTDVRWDYGSTRADPTLVVGASRGGAIQAVDPDGLVAWARAHGAELVLPHPVGDFVHTGEALVLVYGGQFDDRAAEELEGMIALGDERTFDQDPAFALRMMVDIANKALSPAVNDPTTAVQVLDHIGELLGFIGTDRS